MMRGRPWTLRCRVRFLLMMAWRIVILYVRTLQGFRKILRCLGPFPNAPELLLAPLPRRAPPQGLVVALPIYVCKLSWLK